MRIVDERKSKNNLFEEVNISQVFYIEDEQEYGDNPYMRIFKVEDSEGDFLNAVNLQDGQLVLVKDDEEVILCNATLKIY